MVAKGGSRNSLSILVVPRIAAAVINRNLSTSNRCSASIPDCRTSIGSMASRLSPVSCP